METLKSSLDTIMFSGYVAGAFCLGGFIYTSGALGSISNDITAIEKNESAEKEKKLDESARGASAILLDDMKEEKSKRVDVYTSLKNYFDTYFILSAIILSLLVLCTGGLYNTVNGLDFVKCLADDWGYNLARADFIYLYGGLYTVILLLFYVPAKMRFNEITVPDPLKKQAGATDNKWYSFLKNPFSNLKESLIAVSPLLVSIVQSLFDTLFK
ncbi:MAG: hypothetical protein H7Y01_09600 [Ferruginibacter sp.]|nr:hypothetical protein [Chitinophagaceae bacterium]